MRLCVFTEPQQGATYDELLVAAQRAEAAGFDGFFSSDHYLAFGAADGLPGPTDVWTTLAGLARETSRIRLGTLMTSATFRLPGPLAIIVAQVDRMSGGRAELGFGAGWFEAEHRAYGIPFPSIGERFDRFEEQLAVVTGLWSTPVGATFDFTGAHYQVTDSPALPKPIQQPGPPVIVGGWGLERTPRLAARFATEYNVPFLPAAESRLRFAAVVEACTATGRDQIVLSVAQTVCCGATDAQVRQRATAIGRSIESVRESGVVGTPNEVVDQLGEFAELGVTRVFLEVLDLSDLDQLDLIAAEVAPQLV